MEDGLYLLSDEDYSEQLKLNLDPDGHYPLNEVSYAKYDGNGDLVTYWFGIIKKNNDQWYAEIDSNSWNIHQSDRPFIEKAKIIELEDGVLLLQHHVEQIFKYRSPYYRPVVTIDFDHEDGTKHVREINTKIVSGAFPHDIKKEDLTIEDIFDRVGVKLQEVNKNDNVVHARPCTEKNKKSCIWKEKELHGVMETHWRERNFKESEWSVWCFLGKRFESPLVQGLMFDKNRKDKIERQGVAIFEDHIQTRFPNSDDEERKLRLMKFFITVHEIGHAFNFIHSHEKSRGASWPLATCDFDEFSFMYYPERVNPRDYAAFFRRFSFKFNNNEVRFIRHAPERYVIMGGEAWRTNHAFAKQVNGLQFTIEVGQPKKLFEFLEPVVLDYTLTNNSGKCKNLDHVTTEYGQYELTEEVLEVLVSSNNDPKTVKTVQSGIKKFRHFEPYELEDGGKISGSIFVARGNRNWIIQRPGKYKVQVIFHSENVEIASDIMEIEVKRPPKKQSYELNALAKKFYNSTMARTMLLDGTRGLGDSDLEFNLLKEISRNYSNLRLAIHANITLAMVLRESFKYMDFKKREVKELPARADEALYHFKRAFHDIKAAKETLGKFDYEYYHKVYKELSNQHLKRRGR
ncbi:MAG: hypothetical protein AAGA64_11090 [Bacteroidota bacterium]